MHFVKAISKNILSKVTLFIMTTSAKRIKRLLCLLIDDILLIIKQNEYLLLP